MLLVGAWLLRALASTLLLFAVVFLAAMVLNPPVTALERRGFKRTPVAALTVLLLAGSMFAVTWLATPPLLAELNSQAAQAPVYEQRIRRQSQRWQESYPFLRRSLPTEDEWFATLREQTVGAVQWLLRSTFSLVGTVFGAFVAGLLLIFVLSRPRPLIAGYLRLMPQRYREPAHRSLVRLMEQVVAWIKATLIIGVVTGVSTGVLFHLIGVQPAPLFGIMAFMGEFVPTLGPIVAAVPALFVALGMGLDTAGWALLAILFVQQVETNLLVPLIMGRNMDMHPATIVFFALAMASLFGVLGAILAVPVAALANILIDEFYLRPRSSNEASIQSETEAILGAKVCKTEAPDQTSLGSSPDI